MTKNSEGFERNANWGNFLSQASRHVKEEEHSKDVQIKNCIFTPWLLSKVPHAHAKVPRTKHILGEKPQNPNLNQIMPTNIFPFINKYAFRDLAVQGKESMGSIKEESFFSHLF